MYGVLPRRRRRGRAERVLNAGHAPDGRRFRNTGRAPEDRRFRNTGRAPEDRRFRNTGRAPEDRRFRNAGRAPEGRRFRNTGRAPEDRRFRNAGRAPEGRRFPEAPDGPGTRPGCFREDSGEGPSRSTVRTATRGEQAPACVRSERSDPALTKCLISRFQGCPTQRNACRMAYWIVPVKMRKTRDCFPVRLPDGQGIVFQDDFGTGFATGEAGNARRAGPTPRCAIPFRRPFGAGAAGTREDRRASPGGAGVPPAGRRRGARAEGAPWERGRPDGLVHGAGHACGRPLGARASRPQRAEGPRCSSGQDARAPRNGTTCVVGPRRRNVARLGP